MSRRVYRLGRRAETAAATRRRILEATMSLHDEQGIAATSVRDVAGRAGVSPATVLRHFPAMDALIEACGRLSEELYPMPSEAVLAGAAGVPDAIERLARALFTWWEAYGPAWNNLQVDRRTLPQVDGWLRNVDARHRALVAAALGPAADPIEVDVATALTSQGAWSSLRDAGMSPPEAATAVARFIVRGGVP